MYNIEDQRQYSAEEISESMFGLNFVLSYDMEFLEAGPLLNLLGELQPDNLRYPGGSITEAMFDSVEFTENTWAETYLESTQNGVTQRENIANFSQSAGDIGASIQLVLPTKIAFEQSAGQALSKGTYGERRLISPQYFELLEGYIDEFRREAANNGVEVSSFEIGNEFWGAGRMTASEYGFLAATVTEFLNTKYPSINTIAQITYNAGVFSPVEDTVVYLTENGDDFDVHFAFQDLTDIKGLVEYTMPGQGSGVGQTQDIASEFAENPAALAALHGVVDHVYFRSGFEGIDEERNHALINIPKTFEDYSGSGPIEYYISEWSVRNKSGDRESYGTNHVGLQYASSTLEAFFELVSNGVTGANFWPVTFGNENIDRRVLIDTSEEDLTFGGEIFSLMSDNLIGLSPVFDFEIEGEIDIHGFSDKQNVVFFASERSGFTNDAKVDFSNYSFEGKMFLSVTYLREDGTTGVDLNANPVISYLGGSVTAENTIDLNLSHWSLAVVDIQNITDFDDQIYGTLSDDSMRGEGGGDRLRGFSGNDTLSGNFGNDTLWGGIGDDTLKGGWGDDYLMGEAGDDFIVGTHGNNVLNGGLGNDQILGSKGDNFISGGNGDDTIFLAAGASFVDAGDGDDEIIVLESDVSWEAGSRAYNVSSELQMGTKQLILIEGRQMLSHVIVGGEGFDILRLSDAGDALFLDDQYSSFHPDSGIHTTIDGPISIGRISSIEKIFAGQGDDIIDLTSSTFSLAEDSIEVLGEQGEDTLWGSDANEILSGGDGDDHLFGGGGEDTLIGGSGRDVFDFHISDSGDYISDFNAKEGDTLRIFGADNSSGHAIVWNGEVLDFRFLFDDEVTLFSVNIEFDSTSIEGTPSMHDWGDSIVLM